MSWGRMFFSEFMSWFMLKYTAIDESKIQALRQKHPLLTEYLILIFVIKTFNDGKLIPSPPIVITAIICDYVQNFRH